MIQKSVRNLLAAVIAVFSFSVLATAQATQFTAQTLESSATHIASEKLDLSNIKIGNFGQMDERFFRGAQPVMSDYQALKDLGITTVIDLRNDPVDYEKAAVEALGMKYINIPMSGWKSPQQEDVDAFLKLIEDPNTGKFFVHCKAGIHRTGVIGAAYRYTKYDWDYDRVYKEMKDYNYSNGLVHGKLGSFVKKWGKRRASEKAQSAANQTAAPATQGVQQ